MSESPQARLNRLLIDWDKKAEAFEAAVQEAAADDVAYEKYAARERLRLKAEYAGKDEKLTIPDLAAMIIDNDRENLLIKKEMSAGVVTGLRKRLDVFAARADALRSEIASERKRQEAWQASPSVPTARDIPVEYR